MADSKYEDDWDSKIQVMILADDQFQPYIHDLMTYIGGRGFRKRRSYEYLPMKGKDK